MESSSFQNFNKLGACDTPLQKLTNLKIQQPYKLLGLQSVQTTYGRRITVSLEGVDGVVYLPERFKNISDAELEAIREEPNLHLVYKGKKILPNGRSANDIELVKL